MTDTFSATATLLARAAQGDQRAWNALVNERRRLLWSVARSFRLDAADANDVVQTTWLRLLEHLDRIEDPSRLVGWLVTTARREAMRVLRRSGPGAAHHRGHRAGPARRRTARGLSAPAGRAQPRTVGGVLRLNEKCRQLLRVAVTHPQAYDEISEAFGMPIGSIGPTRRRCLTQLRALLEGTVLAEGDGPR